MTSQTNPPGAVEAPSSPSPADAGGAVEVAVPPAGEEVARKIFTRGFDAGFKHGVLFAKDYEERRKAMFWQGFSDGLAAPIALPLYGWRLFWSGQWRDLQAAGVWHGWGAAGRCLLDKEGK
ncbi:hypothetical protein [Xanthobacter versatilis]|uniref:hypothetical protein n=1 Tax=Xanthobacter autotrophicus (strain ATCC BAA-1158 / Py2) TaxID=78245 RepID=UPI00372BC53F